MAKFKDAFDYMIANEVLANNVNKITDDAGGKTKYGISLRFLKNAQIADADFNHDGKIDAQDIIVMTFEQARDLYEKYFWIPIKGEIIFAQPVANKLLDMAVNMGVPQASLLLQRSLNSLGASLAEDRVIGSKTMSLCNSTNATQLMKALREFSVHYYEQILNARPVSADEFHSWMKRAIA